jgi:hypothetical protein
MKKVALTLASVIAATVFAPEASAVPAFARQTGMACDACHFNSYPILTGFGKAFKTGGFTMMGSQNKIEGEHGLSIPAEMNIGVYLQHRIQRKSGTDVATPASAAVAGSGTIAGGITAPVAADGAYKELTQNSGFGRIDFPDEFAVFFAGRVSEGIGSLTELAVGGPNAGVAGTKLVFSTDLGSMKALVVPFTVGGLGPQYGFDLFATGSTANGRPIENQQTFTGSYLGTNGNASGAAIGVASEDFHVTFTPWAEGHLASNSGINATGLGGTYIRAAYTPTIAGFETGFGVQMFGGNALKGVDPVSGGAALGVSSGTAQSVIDNHVNSATIFDAQAQGEVAGMPIGIYGSYGTAAKSTATANNAYNGGSEVRSHMGVLADVGVIPHVLNVQAGLAFAKTGNLVAGAAETDNAIVVGVRYKLRQNVKLALAYSMMSGTAYDAGGSLDTTSTTTTTAGKTLMNIVLSTGF